MRVRAIKKGFYNGDLIEAGQVFEVRDGETASWFESLDKPKDKKEVADSEVSLSGAARAKR